MDVWGQRLRKWGDNRCITCPRARARTWPVGPAGCGTARGTRVPRRCAACGRRGQSRSEWGPGRAGPPGARSPRKAAQNQNRGARPAHHGNAAPEPLRTRNREPRRPAMGTQSQSCSEPEPGGHAGPPWACSPRATQNQNRGATLAHRGHAVPEPLRTRTGGPCQPAVTETWGVIPLSAGELLVTNTAAGCLCMRRGVGTCQPWLPECIAGPASTSSRVPTLRPAPPTQPQRGVPGGRLHPAYPATAGFLVGPVGQRP